MGKGIKGSNKVVSEELWGISNVWNPSCYLVSADPFITEEEKVYGP